MTMVPERALRLSKSRVTAPLPFAWPLIFSRGASLTKSAVPLKLKEAGAEAGSQVPAEFRDLVNPLGDPSSAEEGRALYDSYCASCHGAGGVGTDLPFNPPPTAFASDPHASEWTDGYLFWRIKKGEGGPAGSSMSAYESLLSDDQIWKIVSYLKTL